MVAGQCDVGPCATRGTSGRGRRSRRSTVGPVNPVHLAQLPVDTAARTSPPRAACKNAEMLDRARPTVAERPSCQDRVRAHRHVRSSDARHRVTTRDDRSAAEDAAEWRPLGGYLCWLLVNVCSWSPRRTCPHAGYSRPSREIGSPIWKSRNVTSSPARSGEQHMTPTSTISGRSR